MTPFLMCSLQRLRWVVSFIYRPLCIQPGFASPDLRSLKVHTPCFTLSAKHTLKFAKTNTTINRGVVRSKGGEMAGGGGEGRGGGQGD